MQSCSPERLMVIMAKAVQMASEGDLKAAEFVRDTLDENPKYKIYEKRLEYLIADKEAAHTLVDESWERIFSIICAID